MALWGWQSGLVSNFIEPIRVDDKVMIILSEASIKSRWVERGTNAALEREDRDTRTVLFPTHSDAAVMEAPQPWVEIRRTRHIGDFHDWHHHGAYRTAFERLLPRSAGKRVAVLGILPLEPRRRRLVRRTAP